MNPESKLFAERQSAFRHEILVHKKILGPEQIVEARTSQQQTGTKLQVDLFWSRRFTC